MKYNSQILNIILACALLVMAIKVTLWDASSGKETISVKTNDALENILTRRSVRSFTEQVIPEAKIDTLLRAAMSAPTARNTQPWAFVVITDKNTLKQLAEELPYGKMIAQAPVAIVACGDLPKGIKGYGDGYWVQDVSAATENLLLAAHAMGLGAVWTGVFPVPERIESVKRILSLPDSITPLNVIPVGYPANPGVVKDKYKPENIHYQKW
ncbi:MAG: nitroreductase family protein [Bacteroidales bacterium]